MGLNVRIPFFRIFYSSTYTVLLLCVFVLLAITPADHITQTLENHNLGNIFAIGAVYAVTALIAFFIFASRLYTTRVTLASIPRPYLPIDDGEVSKAVRRLIVKNFQRSALIAWDTRPRDVRLEIASEGEDEQKEGGGHRHHHHLHLHHHTGDGRVVVPIDPDNPPWGPIAHPGWTSPASPDLPSLHFDTVLAELPNLIEAKAVSLAPTEPSPTFLEGYNAQGTGPPNPQMVLVLQRPFNMGLRDYLGYLGSLGVIDSTRPTSAATIARFLSLYEAARFSGRPMTEGTFRDLTSTFADILTIMEPMSEETTQRISDAATSLAIDTRKDSSRVETPRGSGSGSGSVVSLQESVIQAGGNLTSSSSASPPASIYSTGSVVHHTGVT